MVVLPCSVACIVAVLTWVVLALPSWTWVEVVSAIATCWSLIIAPTRESWRSIFVLIVRTLAAAPAAASCAFLFAAAAVAPRVLCAAVPLAIVDLVLLALSALVFIATAASGGCWLRHLECAGRGISRWGPGPTNTRIAGGLQIYICLSYKCTPPPLTHATLHT